MLAYKWLLLLGISSFPSGIYRDLGQDHNS